MSETQTHPFSDDEVRLATMNYESQEWLTRELFNAYELSGMTTRDLARDLEMDASTVEYWLSGDADLSLSDLRHLATALDAHVTYSVEPLVHRLPRWIDDISNALWTHTSWSPTRLGR